MFKNQLIVSLRKKNFLVSFLIMLILCFGYYLFIWSLAMKQTDKSHICSAQSAVILCGDGNAPMVWIVEMLFPFLALLPNSFSYLNDKQLRMDNIYISRAGKMQYYFSKVVVCFIATFLVFFVPCLMNLIQAYITFPTNGTLLSGLDISTTAHDWYILKSSDVNLDRNEGNVAPLLSLLLNHPFVYDLIYTIVFSAYAGLIGVLGLSLSYRFNPKWKLLLFLPYLIFSKLIENMIPILYQKLDDRLVIGSIMVYISPEGKLSGDYSNIFFALYLLFIILLIVALNSMQIRKDQL